MRRKVAPKALLLWDHSQFVDYGGDSQPPSPPASSTQGEVTSATRMRGANIDDFGDNALSGSEIIHAGGEERSKATKLRRRSNRIGPNNSAKMSSNEVYPMRGGGGGRVIDHAVYSDSRNSVEHSISDEEIVSSSPAPPATTVPPSIRPSLSPVSTTTTNSVAGDNLQLGNEPYIIPSGTYLWNEGFS